MLSPLVGLAVKSPVQVFSSVRRRGEAAVLGWAPWVECELMPKAGLAHQGHGVGDRDWSLQSFMQCAEIQEVAPAVEP